MTRRVATKCLKELRIDREVLDIIVRVLRERQDSYTAEFRDVVAIVAH